MDWIAMPQPYFARRSSNTEQRLTLPAHTTILKPHTSREGLLNRPEDSERRRRDRVSLHWRVLLFRPTQSATIETVTENITSLGFYCTTPEPFTPGESLECSIVIPRSVLDELTHEVLLGCRVRVVHVKKTARGYGLGCCVDYHKLV